MNKQNLSASATQCRLRMLQFPHLKAKDNCVLEKMEQPLCCKLLSYENETSKSGRKKQNLRLTQLTAENTFLNCVWLFYPHFNFVLNFYSCFCLHQPDLRLNESVVSCVEFFFNASSSLGKLICSAEPTIFQKYFCIFSLFS